MRLFFLLLLSMVTLSACSEIQFASHLFKKTMPPTATTGTFKVGNPYKIAGKMYYPKEQYNLVETGIASWYGPGFNGKKTANGETFDQRELTAAHRTLQLPSLIRVTNLENGRSLVVRVNDRGPFSRGRILDLSERSAELLGFKNKGTAKIRLEVLPEESRRIAMAAKQGYDTGGYEVAMNGSPGGEREPIRDFSIDVTSTSERTSAEATVSGDYGTATVKPVTVETLSVGDTGTPVQVKSVLPGHIKGGDFYPDPIIAEMPVRPTSIYVQAGSFTVYKNADALSNRLSAYGETHLMPANVNGQKFYRVRLGPIENVEMADELLARLVQAGNQNAIIIVE